MKHLVFDTETTALIENSSRALAKQPRIFEIAGIVWDDADDAETFHHWQIDPGAPITPLSTKKTGVTDAMVKGRPLFSMVAPYVRQMIEPVDVAVAHNVVFDCKMIDLEFARMGEAVAWPQRRVCTVEHTEHLKGHRLNLEDLHKLLFNEGFPKAHSAEADTRALLRIYKELLKQGEIIHERPHPHRLLIPERP